MKKSVTQLSPNRLFIAFVACLLISSCTEKPETSDSQSGQSDTQSGTVASSGTAQANTQNQEKFEPDYISAEDLGKLFENDQQPLIFDVRSQPAFEKSHIETALLLPYGSDIEDRLEEIAGLTMETDMVTYCGCPRHLSALSAQKLEALGYSNVQVLYEGFWHWKDNGYPTVLNEATAEITQLRFEGSVADADMPVSGMDIFLKHQDTGQLEAAVTDSEGRFEIDFNLYDYQEHDVFEVIVAKVDEVPYFRAQGSADSVNKLNIRL